MGPIPTWFNVDLFIPWLPLAQERCRNRLNTCRQADGEKTDKDRATERTRSAERLGAASQHANRQNAPDISFYTTLSMDRRWFTLHPSTTRTQRRSKGITKSTNKKEFT